MLSSDWWWGLSDIMQCTEACGGESCTFKAWLSHAGHWDVITCCFLWYRVQRVLGICPIPHPLIYQLPSSQTPFHSYTHQGKAHEGYHIKISPTLLTHHSCGCKSLCQTSTIWRYITEPEPRTAQRSWQGQRKNEGITGHICSRRHGLELQ